jgi:hypothetical protein
MGGMLTIAECQGCKKRVRILAKNFARAGQVRCYACGDVLRSVECLRPKKKTPEQLAAFRRRWNDMAKDKSCRRRQPPVSQPPGSQPPEKPAPPAS